MEQREESGVWSASCQPPARDQFSPLGGSSQKPPELRPREGRSGHCAGLESSEPPGEVCTSVLQRPRTGCREGSGVVTFTARGPHRTMRGLDQRKTQLVRKGAGHSPAPSYGEDWLSIGSPEDREGAGQIKGPGKKGASVLEAVGKTGQKRAGAHRYPRAQTGFPSAEMQSALGILGPRVHAGARASVGSSGQQDAGVWMQKPGGALGGARKLQLGGGPAGCGNSMMWGAQEAAGNWSGGCRPTENQGAMVWIPP